MSSSPRLGLCVAVAERHVDVSRSVCHVTQTGAGRANMKRTGRCLLAATVTLRAVGSLAPGAWHKIGSINV